MWSGSPGDETPDGEPWGPGDLVVVDRWFHWRGRSSGRSLWKLLDWKMRFALEETRDQLDNRWQSHWTWGRFLRSHSFKNKWWNIAQHIIKSMALFLKELEDVFQFKDTGRYTGWHSFPWDHRLLIKMDDVSLLRGDVVECEPKYFRHQMEAKSLQ